MAFVFTGSRYFLGALKRQSIQNHVLDFRLRKQTAQVQKRMKSELIFIFRNRAVPVTVLPSVSPTVAQTALDSEVFKTWCKRCEAEKDGKRIELESVEIQNVDMFGPRVGFLKIRADSTLVDGITHHKHRLPGICFLRGGSVTILVALICEELGGKVFSVLVDQPRVPIGAASCLELPAGMVDDENDGIAGTAAKELEEECGIKLRPSDLTDLTELAFQGEVQSGNLPQVAIAPSPGGSDEYLRYMYVERLVTRSELEQMKGRLSGLREEGEYITLRVIPLQDIWRVSADNKAMCALFLADQLRRDGKLPRIGGLLPLPKDPTIRLQDGRLIPSLAFGLYKIPVDEEGVSVILEAIRAGYRHFDCATIYGNEAALGKALRISGLPREEFFICSKVWNDAQKKGVAAVRTSIEDSIRWLGCDYIDLMYVHWPVPGHFVETYKVLQEFHSRGHVRNIGMSNFGISEFEELMASDAITITPAVNQIEISPFMYRPRTIQYFQDRGICMVASKALHRAYGLEEGIIQSIATNHKVTAAQVLIRWGIQKGLVVVAKTSSSQRMEENRGVGGFSLTSEEMTELDSLTSEDQIMAREKLEVERKNDE